MRKKLTPKYTMLIFYFSIHITFREIEAVYTNGILKSWLNNYI